MTKYKLPTEKESDDTLIRTLDEVSEMYFVEKERADRLEKQMNELKDTVSNIHKEAIFDESRSNDDSDMGIIWACEMILAKINDLEEDEHHD